MMRFLVLLCQAKVKVVKMGPGRYLWLTCIMSISVISIRDYKLDCGDSSRWNVQSRKYLANTVLRNSLANELLK